MTFYAASLHKERIIMTENRLNIDEEGAPEAAPSKKKRFTISFKIDGNTLIALIMMVFTILLALINLCPVVTTEVEFDGMSGEASLTAIDCLQMAYFQTGAGYLEASDAYEKLVDYGYPEISNSMLYSGLTKELLFAEIMDADACFKISPYYMALAVVANFVFCILLFANSAIHLLFGVFNNKKAQQKSIKALNNLRLASLIYLLLMPLYCYMLLRGTACGIGELRIRAMESSVGVGFVLGIVLASFILLFSFKDVISKYKKTNGSAQDQKVKLIALGCAALMLLSLCLPIMTVKATASFKNKTVTDDVTVGYNDIFCVNNMDLKYYRGDDSVSMAELLTDNLSYHKDSLDKTILYDVIIGIGGKDHSFWTHVFYIFQAVSLLCFAIIAYRLILALLKNEGATIKTPVIIAIFSAVLQFAAVVAIALMGSTSLWSQQEVSCEFSVGIGIVLKLVASIGMLVGTIKYEADKENEESYDYDNPDVSYAPYVVVREE